MIARPIGHRWILGLALLGAAALLAAGCGPAPAALVPVADEPAPPPVAPPTFTDQTPSSPGTPGPVQPATEPGQPAAGDLDGNGVIDQADKDAYLARFQNAFGTGDGSATYDPPLDMNGDGVISWADLQLFVKAAEAD